MRPERACATSRSRWISWTACEASEGISCCRGDDGQPERYCSQKEKAHSFLLSVRLGAHGQSEYPSGRPENPRQLQARGPPQDVAPRLAFVPYSLTKCESSL